MHYNEECDKEPAGRRRGQKERELLMLSWERRWEGAKIGWKRRESEVGVGRKDHLNAWTREGSCAKIAGIVLPVVLPSAERSVSSGS